LGLLCIWAFLFILGASHGFRVCGFFWEGSLSFGGFLGLGFYCILGVCLGRRGNGFASSDGLLGVKE
jgi:hypothetical protein